MKTHKYIVVLTLVAAALSNCVQAMHLQKEWYRELASTSKPDTTYDTLSDDTKTEAKNAEELNKFYKSSPEQKISTFQRKYKNNITGTTNRHITELRNLYSKRTKFAEGRLKELLSAQKRMHNANKKGKNNITNNAQDIIEQQELVVRSLAKDEPAYTAKLDKKLAKEARIKAKADKEKQTIEDKKRIQQERREAARARTLRNRPSKRKAPAVLENKNRKAPAVLETKYTERF